MSPGAGFRLAKLPPSQQRRTMPAAELFAPHRRLSEKCNYVVRSQQVNPWLQLTTVAKANL